jgi:predicted RNA-binding Zn ribbon-like protein
METPDHIRRMPLVGGNLALDYINTRGGQPNDETLQDYNHLVAWACHAGMLTEAEARRLRRRGRRNPGDAQHTYQRAVQVRSCLYELFAAVAMGRPPPGRCLAALRSDEAEALTQAELVSGEGGFAWSWAHDEELGRPLRPIVHAAVALLTAGPLQRVKQCDGCQWFFIDESKNRSRRWCSMQDCGTDQKIRRYLARRAATRR